MNISNKTLIDLWNLDVEIDNEDKTCLLLNSLPDTYEHLTTTLLDGKDEIKFNNFSNALMNNEVWKKDQHARRDTPFEALTTSGRKMNQQNGKR